MAPPPEPAGAPLRQEAASRTVCHVLHSLQVGGAEVLAASLARHLRGEHRFVFVCLDRRGAPAHEVAIGDSPLHVLARRPGLDLRCVLRLARVLRRERVQLVHAHNYSPFLYSLLARRLYRRPAILFTEHGRPFPDAPRPKRMVANRLLLERRDRVVAVGEAVRAALIRNEGLAPDRVAVVHNGAGMPAPDDADGGAGGGFDRDAARAELGVARGGLVILQVARLEPVKDHATAVRALERVVERRPDARLIVAGEGESLEALRATVAERRLGKVVQVLGFRHDVPRLLRAADVFLLTSRSEGLPLALIEAMAAGLPIVATRVGGVPEVVEDGATGLLAPAGDDAGLAECVLQLAQDAELRVRMGRAARRRADAFFGERRMSARYGELYRELLPGRG